ncbi:diguanylate cyclase [Williamsia sp. MIQD14]|uniref:GGDEF domain-containing protein n=1 Tax=Williamsia sp. MIQD14 TaxID=3425703 RepID=UPI003DA06051
MRSAVGEMRRTVLHLAVAAWGKPDRFQWFSDYLEMHSLRAFVRLAVAFTTALISIIPFVNMASPDGAAGPVRYTTAVIAGVGGCALAVLWMTTAWPDRRRSITFVALADVFITLGLFSDSLPLAGLAGATVFAVVGGYCAFFHNTRVLAAHVAMVTLVTAVLATMTAVAGDPAMAISKAMVVILVNLVIPATSQVLLGMLSSDSVESRRDPLTQLPNRRGLEQAVASVGRYRPRGPDDVVVAIVLDLDAFKRVNDARGHECGDLVLAETAHRLAATIGDADIPCRMGGEEFVVVARRPLGEAAVLAERIRTAVLAPNQGLRVTASVGVAWADAEAMSVDSAATVVENLIRSADRAMYDAKRSGGNRVRLHTDRDDTADEYAG